MTINQKSNHLPGRHFVQVCLEMIFLSRVEGSRNVPTGHGINFFKNMALSSVSLNPIFRRTNWIVYSAVIKRSILTTITPESETTGFLG